MGLSSQSPCFFHHERPDMEKPKTTPPQSPVKEPEKKPLEPDPWEIPTPQVFTEEDLLDDE